MKIEKKDNNYYFVFNRKDGEPAYSDAKKLPVVDGWKSLAQLMINYCTGKEYKSISSWLSRILPFLDYLVTETEFKSIPGNSRDWALFISNLYAAVLTANCSKAAIKTRVSTWNKNIRPFLIYLQEREYIPIDVIIPSMKKVSQKVGNTSFNVKLIGEKQAFNVEEKEWDYKLLTPVSLSRTDAEYLDEIYYDLERKRNKVHQCLVDYWKTIKSHYEYGYNLLKNVDRASIESRLKTNNIYIYHKHEERVYPVKEHFACGESEESLANLLYLYKSQLGYYRSLSKKKNGIEIPNQKSIYKRRSYFFQLFPECLIENNDSVTFHDRMNWALGNLQNRDISFIIALLMMECPKFTYESLLSCKSEDKDGKTFLETNEHSVSFTIDKKRAKQLKKENLSELSFEILSTLIEMRDCHKELIPDKIKKWLFVSLANQSLAKAPYRIPQSYRISAWLTGNTTKKCYVKKGWNVNWLGTCYPSIEDVGLTRNTISHKKIRTTEGVLEFFRTGSVKAVSRKLGNTKKVVLSHYLPEPLIAAYNTRQVRRFQNLLIVAATIDEDYLLNAVDFNNASELHSFIADMLAMDSKGSNPLLNHIKSQTGTCDEPPKGELITNISEKSLTILYAYNLVAEKYNIDANVLACKDIHTGISPLAFISLSKYINIILSSHSDSNFRTTNKVANKQAIELSRKIKWGELLCDMEKVS